MWKPSNPAVQCPSEFSDGPSAVSSWAPSSSQLIGFPSRRYSVTLLLLLPVIILIITHLERRAALLPNEFVSQLQHLALPSMTATSSRMGYPCCRPVLLQLSVADARDLPNQA